ncbi:Prolyl-tRNA synthetase [Caldalkalibacillus thermarum TA2.A1]|uniref:Proline--tRNA ligase n=1 Tax=Caldalkalibacillus thermarum (strain TA2.A1) TaxID=986075 RepID=F5L4K4_CALTT|nr:proline--tRNA ligase [Caldalkalibacillus thermarum]EGL83721.1 Prolyl-tRNA synthetase [Caldalkalibacillus thermarum TA2.A1]QZT32988.1 proline--tRNA ligase [Caldalkalibacillus thermarum TA2.A1]
MRQQHYLIPTLRDIPADAEVVSHQLMLRAGLIRQLASGLYTYLPLAQRVLKKIQAIIREEMDKAGAQEILMPALHPAEIWQETGRWDVYGPELMRLYDRHERQFALGPTHEEVVTALLRDEVKSYKRLPMTVYQIQTKFRDERRPRFGVLRAREFIMKDAYSFDTSPEGLDESYRKMYEAYQSIFSRCGLNFRAVEADSGAIGGTGTHEFMVLSDVGEDTIAYCDSCQYAANIEKAEVIQRDYRQIEGTGQPMEKVNTPQAKTVNELADMLDVSPRQIIKAVALDVDGQVVVALVRGDFELNEVKVKNLFGADRVELLDEERIRAELGSEPGFIGPVGLHGAVLIADHSVKGMQDAVTGANEKDKHYIHVTVGRDFAVERYEDLRQITEGDACPRCEGTIRFAKGIEVGHVFKLGTKYSEAMGATFLDENGNQQPMIMGCYGIGVTRLLAAIIEQHHDEHGIIWPRAVAPFDIHLISVNMKDDLQRELAEQLYVKLQQAGFDVLYDDREERAGVKFKDADLIGIPLRVTVGKKAGDGIVECKLRRTGETEEIKADELIQILPRLLEQA